MFGIHFWAESKLKSNGNMIEDPDDLIKEQRLY